MQKLLLIIIICCICLGLGISAAYMASQLLPVESVESLSKTTEQPQSQNVTLTLPGADPIDAMREDFTQPTSLWAVVSKTHPLPDGSYKPDDLQLLSGVATRTDKSAEERSLRAWAVSDLNKLFAAANDAGHTLLVGSAFRSYELQTTYYTNYVRTSGEAAASQFSAKPGESEHQTGLAVDISLVSLDCYLETCFGQTEAGKWLAQNAPTYGFILRYPADKTAITGYQYEPWHFRYVGQSLAGALTRSGLTLDEAYPYLESARNELIEKKLLTV